MADTKLSDLTAVTTPVDTDLFYTSQSSTDKKATRAQIVTPTVNTVTATDASYTPAQHEIIILDDAGDDTDIDVTFAAALSAGQRVTIYAEDGGATNHSVVLGGSQTWDGTNQTAVFADANDYLSVVAISATRVLIIENSGVTFSA